MKRISRYLAGLTVLAMTAPAFAGGYQLNDYSVTGLGRSYAGQGVVGDDYSAIAYNPAGMTLMEKSGVQQALSVINLKSDLYGLGADSGKKAKMDFWQPIPAGFAQYNVDKKLFIGAGIYAPYGLKTQYKSDWFGSDSAVLSKLDIVDFNLSAAYKLDEHWSIGASAILRYIYGRMTQTIPSAIGGGDINFNVHGWSQTGTLGIMYEENKNTRFGLSYRLRSAQRAKGKLKTTGNPAVPPLGLNAVAPGTYDVRANPDLPETFTFSAYHRYKDVGFTGTARWTHWTSSFPNFSVRSEGIPTGGEKFTDYSYRNSWTLTAGADWYYDKNWTFRCGGGWDESPTHDAKRRTFRIPDNDRWWMSVGASYVLENWQLDFAYAHMIGKTGEATEDPQHQAKYKNLQSHILGLQVQYKF